MTPQKSRPYLGLTQANRLLRAEFNPLYSHKPTIHLSTMSSYLKTFPLPDRAPSANLSVTLVALSNRIKIQRSPGIDILPLLTLNWAALPFVIEEPAYHRGCRYDQDLEFVRLAHRLVVSLTHDGQTLLRNGTIAAVGWGQKKLDKKHYETKVPVSLNPMTAMNLDIAQTTAILKHFTVSLRSGYALVEKVECRSAGRKYSWASNDGHFRVPGSRIGKVYKH